MSSKKRFVLRIPLKKLKAAKQKTTNDDDKEDLKDGFDDSSSNTTNSPINTNAQPNNNNDQTASEEESDSDDDDMHGIDDINEAQIISGKGMMIPALCTRLDDDDLYTDASNDEEEEWNPMKKRRRLHLKSRHDDDDEDEEFLDGIERKEFENELNEIKKEEKERVRKEKLMIVDREYENLMKTSLVRPVDSVTANIYKRKSLKVERQKELDMMHLSEDNWIQNEKHSLSLRHISIRDDKKRILQSFVKNVADAQQFLFMKNTLSTYFNLKEHKIDSNLFKSIDCSLFDCNKLDKETKEKIMKKINEFEQFIADRHFEILHEKKSVNFDMNSYQKDVNSVKNKLESCPILYILLIRNEINFESCLQFDNISICLICINSMIRKKIQKKLIRLVKQQKAECVEGELFEHWNKNRLHFIKQIEEKEQKKEEKKTQTDEETVKEEEEEEDKSKILHDKYPIFCQKYLNFLGSFPDYRNCIISNDISMQNIFLLSDQQMCDPPILATKQHKLKGQSITKKRKYVSNSMHSASSKRRKLSSSSNGSKQKVIWDGVLINDSIKCHVKMKQCGGKSIWTIPFKQRSLNKSQLSITGRLRILSIMKFIKQLRKHKTRRILFAEVENNEFVKLQNYNILASQLKSSGRAGVIDFEKQCGILMYIISSNCLEPTHPISHQLLKYFDGHKAKVPKTKIWSIIILHHDAYNQVKRKMSKSTPKQKKGHQIPSKPAQPPAPINHGNGKPPQPPSPPAQKIDNAGNSDDDLGDLPPPLPPHLLAERKMFRENNSETQRPAMPQPPPPPVPPRPPPNAYHSQPPFVPVAPPVNNGYPPQRPMPPPPPQAPPPPNAMYYYR